MVQYSSDPTIRWALFFFNIQGSQAHHQPAVSITKESKNNVRCKGESKNHVGWVLIAISKTMLQNVGLVNTELLLTTQE